jgi:DNA-binding NtrC family response regulator
MLSRSRGTLETILVVDDNEAVLHVVAAALESADFRVLVADSPAAALRLAKKKDEKIDLLLSDVEMPDMSGPDLGETLKETRPDLHVMLMSGGAHGNLLVLNYGWAYIQKPFVADKLIQMVTEVLHSKNRSQMGGAGIRQPERYEQRWMNKILKRRRLNKNAGTGDPNISSGYDDEVIKSPTIA